MRLLLAFAMMVLAGCRPAAELPVLGTVPAFTLTDQAGQPFALQQLKGHVWIADLIFTNCPGACLRMSRHMKRLADQTPASVQLVSFTVDPDRDTPAVLAAYAKRYQADTQRWHFLTGARAELNKVSNGFFLGDIQIDHSTRFMLIDRDARIRAFYRTEEPDAVERLFNDAVALAGK